MKIDYQKLQETDWDTGFDLETKSPEEILIRFDSLTIDKNEFQDVRLKFENPRNEWAMLWNEGKQDWEDHPDKNAPIGNRIIAFNAKPVGKNLKYSFGGNHGLGWSRWGFSASNFELIINEEKNES